MRAEGLHNGAKAPAVKVVALSPILTSRSAKDVGWDRSAEAVPRGTPVTLRGVARVANIDEMGPLEQARRFRRQEANGATQGEIARRAGVTRTFVCKRLQLLSLPPSVKRLAEEEHLSFTSLYLLTELPNATAQRRVARQLVKHGWSTRELEVVVARELGRTPPPRRRTYRGPHPDAAALAEILAESITTALGAQVDVKPAGRGRFQFRITAANAEHAIATAVAMGARPATSSL